ncbi:MAG: hypothetical protein IKZ95_04810, partial [Lachnospiraceae bacterium]|nr:hypothetical protein [Lachnospiraceae bacterium]
RRRSGKSHPPAVCGDNQITEICVFFHHWRDIFEAITHSQQIFFASDESKGPKNSKNHSFSSPTENLNVW